MPPCFELGLLPTGLQAFFHWPFIPSPPIPARTFIFVTLRSFPLADERMESGIESMEQTDEESWTPPPSSLDDVLADKVVFSPQPATYSHLPTTCNILSVVNHLRCNLFSAAFSQLTGNCLSITPEKAIRF